MIVKFDDEKVGTAEEALELMGAKFTVSKAKLTAKGNVVVPSHCATMREDTNQVLGVVGSRYGVIQNAEAFAFFDTVVASHDAQYTSGALMHNGAWTILQAKVNGEREVRKGDGLQNYITLVNGHDGRQPFKAWFTPIRLWCMNQVRGILRNIADAVTVRHTANASDRVQEALRVLGCSREYFEHFIGVAEKLTQVAATSDMVEKFLAEVMGESERKPSQTRRDHVRHLIEHGRGNTGETLWDVYNGLTEWADWYRVEGDDEDRRLRVSLWSGGLKERAWSTVTKMAGVN